MKKELCVLKMNNEFCGCVEYKSEYFSPTGSWICMHTEKN